MPQDRVHLIAEARQIRNGVRLIRGDPFTATVKEAADLVALNFASYPKHDDAGEEVVVTSPNTKSSIAKKVLEPDASIAQPKSGRYRRRDLRADE